MSYERPFYHVMTELFLMSCALPPRQKFAGIGGFARYFEYPLAICNLVPISGTVLDVGSGGTIFPIYLARRGAHVTLLDLNADALRLAGQRIDKLARKYGLEDCFSVRVDDATRMTLPDSLFDAVTCISMIEHPYGDGDSATIREIARVLRPGGRVFVSFPYDQAFSVNLYATRRPWKEADGRDKIERRYDQRSIEERIIKPSGLELVKQGYVLGAALNKLTTQLNRLEWQLGRIPILSKTRNLKGLPYYCLAQAAARFDRADAHNAEFTYLVLSKS